MAAEKKKTEKKAAEKKTAKKVVATVAKAAKTPVKKGKKKTEGDYSVEINVPRGGQVIQNFNLVPAFPTATGAGDWIFSEPGSTTDITGLTVRFQLNPSALERTFERAILVVSMQQNPATNGTWRFALDGVATADGDCDPDNDIVVEVIDNGFTLLIYVQVLENSEEMIPFQFVASFTDAVTGAVSIYQSQDPTIYPKRP
ncbi:DP-EP family protein [Cellvibrio sp. UBA7661]|uniref:DP-EP family protein n=1 Tax=Cellvibrio sp. UBA7661 TaxID=1946311 RepID=UPI002F35043A